MNRDRKIAKAMLCQSWKSESELIKITNKLILISSLGFFGIVVINAIWDLKMLHLYDVCMRMESKTKTLSVIGVLLLIFRILMIIITILVDIDCLFRVRTYKNRSRYSLTLMLDAQKCFCFDLERLCFDVRLLKF